MVLAMMLLGGCASHSQIEPVQSGRYRISALGVQGPADAAERAGEDAENFCAERGERAQILDVTRGSWLAEPTQVTVMFTCISTWAQR